jgi:hypothetical protein
MFFFLLFPLICGIILVVVGGANITPAQELDPNMDYGRSWYLWDVFCGE